LSFTKFSNVGGIGPCNVDIVRSFDMYLVVRFCDVAIGLFEIYLAAGGWLSCVELWCGVAWCVCCAVFS
jgi:hypothetical protein